MFVVPNRRYFNVFLVLHSTVSTTVACHVTCVGSRILSYKKHNSVSHVITGAGLDKASGYSETTSNSQCTQYESADCEKY